MDLPTYLRQALSGPGAFRFVVQPVVAFLLALRDGRRDARSGTRPFFEQLLFEPLQRRALMKSAGRTLLVPFCVAFAIDSIVQLVLVGQWRLVRALVVGVLLIGLPYTLFRGLFARAFRRTERRRPRRLSQNP